MYVCASILRGGEVVVSDYAIAETEAEALTRARRRFASEQG